MTLWELFADLARQKWTGTLVLHFRRGEPKMAEYGRPKQVDLTAPIEALSENSSAQNLTRT